MEEEQTLAANNKSNNNSNSIANRLSLQNQVLKWIQEFSDKLEMRAKGAAAQVNGLLEEAADAELDMKTTVISFNNLSRQRFIEHKVLDEDDMPPKMRENTQSSFQSQVPAQDYERDILPRYREALHMGLASCKDHLRNKGRSTTSVFRAMSTYGPLPHIIGSEEYNHDNSCGLADDLQASSDDFSWLREFQGESTDVEAPDLFGSHMLGMQQRPDKGEVEPLVSAARDFKAMLEAALVNPYKFYDDDASVVAHDTSVDSRSTGEMHYDVDPVIMRGSEDDLCECSTQHDISEEKGLLAHMQNPDAHAHDLYSALVTDSLFDAEDEFISFDQKESDSTPASAPVSASGDPGLADSAASAERTLSEHENTSTDDESMIKGVGTSLSNNEEEQQKDKVRASLPHELKDDISESSSPGNGGKGQESSGTA